MRDIQCNRLDKGFCLYQEEYEKKAIEVLRSGWYILGHELENFEKEFAEYLEIDYCIGVASGLDALKIAVSMLEIGEGDEVIVQANTYIATIMAITENGATPILVEPDEYYNIDVTKIEEKITEKTKAIMIVHLYGQPADMTAIMNLAERYHLKVIEDCAQAHGAEWKRQKVGTFGDIGCFSFYPTKNLGAFGDGGALVTNDKSIYEKVKIYRNYGSEKKYYNQMIGINSRLDEIQAALLTIKLKHLEQLNEEREIIADKYIKKIKNPNIILPHIQKHSRSVWHQFVIRVKKRDDFMSYMESKNIHCMIHYPIPPHLSEAYRYMELGEGSFPVTEEYSKQVVSLPMYNGMSDDELDYTINVLNEYRE